MKVTLTWQGGEHDFALPIGQLRALQDRCDAGPGFVLQRLSTSQWRIEDVTETIRLALMGGGMDRKEASKLVELHVEEKPLAQSATLAAAILMSRLYDAPEDDPVGETIAGAEAPSHSRGDDGSSQPSTEPAQL